MRCSTTQSNKVRRGQFGFIPILHRNSVWFFIGDNMKRIPLSQGKYALVDNEDFKKLSKHKWCAIQWGNTWGAVRNSSKVNGKQRTIYMHREILGLRRGGKIQVDHKNHNGLDNRRSNLRPCTAQQNQWNYTKASGKSSKYKGVSKHKDGGWVANITVFKKQYYLGYFKSEIEAAIAYNKMAQKHFGEFAKLNIIKEKDYGYKTN